MSPRRVADIIELSIAERIQAVEDIWDSIAAVPEAVPLSERQKAEAGRIADILHPDTSKRLRFPSLGDAPRARPVRTEFKSDAHFKAALAHWNQEQKFEAEVYERSLR